MVHIGIIPDGNRRFCKKNNVRLDKLADYWLNNTFYKFLNLINNNYNKIDNGKLYHFRDINELSFYMLSADNIKKRSLNNVKVVYYVFRKLATFLINAHYNNFNKYHLLLNKVNICIIGDFTLVPYDIKLLITKINLIYNNNNAFFQINIAFAYDPIKDIKNIVSNNYMRRQTVIDMIIRTSGEQRISGFFPYHSMNSEFIFVDKLWPEFNIDDLNKCVNIFNKRNRRFGK